MKAVTFQAPHEVRVDDKPEPELQAGDDAIVKIEATGVCGSDLHIYHGRVQIDPGFTIGHEFVGTVLSTGDQVTSVSEGDRVLGCFHTACGRCFFCMRGWYMKCDEARVFGHGETLGSLQGTQAEQALVPTANLTLRRMPDGVSDEVALFAGDVMGTGYHSVTSAGVRAGDFVAVLGLGPVGLCAVQAALAAGAAHVVAIDAVEDRLEMARSFGAEPVHLTEGDPRGYVKKATGGRGVDVAVDAVGHPEALELAIRLARKCGTVSVVGVYAERVEVHMGLAWIKSLNMVTGHANVIAHVDPVLELIAAGKLDPSPLVTHHMPLDDAAEAYELYDKREALKIVLDAVARMNADDVERAAQTIAGRVRVTPTLPAESLSERAGAPVFLKAENLQRTGSFKIRGATNAIANLSARDREAGVVAASAGNHAQAVALAATAADISAILCMPAGAPVAKLEAVRHYGGEVRLVDGSYDEAQEDAGRLAEAEGRALIHPFADPVVVAGQGTVGREIVEALPDVASIVVPLGGGGLISGIAIAAKARVPGVRLIGVQAEACAPFPTSLAAHQPVGARSARTIADGIAVKRPAELTLRLVESHVDEVVTVSEDEIARTMVHLLERAKLVVEGAGAVAAAAVRHGRIDVSGGGPCCVVLSGGNVDASLLAECIRMGETAAGRRTVLKMVVPDRPGALAHLLGIVAGQGANIIDVEHLREGVDLHVRETLIRLVVETRGADQAAAVVDAIAADGFAVEVER